MPMTNDKNTYDAIVIGVGSMGAAATYYLAKQGAKVLGLEQFDLVHPNGGHMGQSRLIRKAYAEHPDYVPLLERAYQNWVTIEQLTGEKLFNRSGLAYFGEPHCHYVKDVKVAAGQYDIPIEEYTQAEVKARFPWFKLSENQQAIWEPNAGYVTPERTILTFANAAREQGATIQTNETVFNWQLKDNRVKVSTSGGTYFAEKLVITAGAYTTKILPQLVDKIQVTHQLLAWVQPDKNIDLTNFPCWVVDLPDVPGIYYGFAQLTPEWLSAKANQTPGLKIGHHTPGKLVLPKDLPLSEDVELIAKEKENLKAFVAQYLPGLQSEFLEVKHCLYANSPDEHFIIDHLPDYDKKVTVATGFSGHGFKFVPAVGEVLAELALEGKTDLPIEFLSLQRELEI